MFSAPITLGKHQLPPLPYPYNALEPIISSTTLKYHHDKHHKSYVNNLNKSELELVKARKNNDFELIKFLERELAFNGSGHILHSIYWSIMAPIGCCGQPKFYTMQQISNSFGNFEAFKEQLIKAAIKVEASGWGILSWNPTWRRLEILTAEKHQNLTEWGSIPILVVDIWEHAYYLDYQYKRSEYVNKWWKLINWYAVEKRLLLAIDGKLPITLF
ncbi:superoxide dismutase [Clostridium aestuarii]|uniref:Superoxide dismutase n=1 Tax=Clostridium aestuarii TaxID=338193 RepID=A0ABT4CZ18_9CLOT|nr:superoxide dismutase [Clostridium aestuarii]MCY6484229.1 superoxide dismutase [Clostridium aestuarii]